MVQVEIDDLIDAIPGEVGLRDFPAGQQNMVGGRRFGRRRTIVGCGRQHRRLHNVVLEETRQREDSGEDDNGDNVASDVFALTAQRGVVRSTEAGVALNSDQYRQIDRQRVGKQRSRVDVLAEHRNNRTGPSHVQQERVKGGQHT